MNVRDPIVLWFVISLSTASLRAASIWLGDDTVGSVTHVTTTGMLISSLPLPVTGIAWDGTNLWFSGSGGLTQKRTSDGLTVLSSFTVPLTGSPSEDLAWDSNRSRLWRVDHTGNGLVRINPMTGMADAVYDLPDTSAALPGVTLGALGVAYDSRRDLLYVSACPIGCSSLSVGLVRTVDPSTGLVLSTLFSTSGFATGGLGYDPSSDTLWVGDNGVVRNMSLGGAVLSVVPRPPVPAGFADGLEFISDVPEPATIGLAWLGLALLFAGRFRLARRS